MMREFDTGGESPFYSINQRLRQMRATSVTQLELGFTDLEGPIAVTEEPDTSPKGKKNPTPVLSDFVQIPLQAVGFPYVPIGSALHETHLYMGDQRRRHDKEGMYALRSPQ